THAGIFARLAAEAVAGGLEPPTLLALLKHPMCRLGAAEGALKPAIEALELALLRGTRPRPGTAGLAGDFDQFRAEPEKLRRGQVSSLHRSEPRTRLWDFELDRVQALIAPLQTALKPLEILSSTRLYDFAEIASRHRDVLIELSRDKDGTSLAFEEREGLALA